MLLLSTRYAASNVIDLYSQLVPVPVHVDVSVGMYTYACSVYVLVPV